MTVGSTHLLTACLLLVGTCCATPAMAQSTPAGALGTGAQDATFESDPLRCWLKSTKTSVHVGEQFDVALTCAVVETTRAAVVPDVSQLEPASIEMAPFEVLSGRRHPDIRQGMWRYFQYEYTVRVIADGFFGQDLAVPPISLSYRVNMMGTGVLQEGREKTYVLPQLPIRVVSLVPAIATDIRDAARDTFAHIAERNLLANVAFIVAGILYAFAAVLALTLLLRAFGTLRQRRTGEDRSMPPAALASAALRSLRRIERARSRDGWTPELLTQGLALARIAGALSIRRPVAQAAATPDSLLDEGQVLAVSGVLKRRAVLLSAAVTPASLEATPLRIAWPDRRALYADIGAALTLFSEARYSRAAVAAASDFDAALARIRRALERTKTLDAWPVRALGSLRVWWRSRRGPEWAR
jgi:hypothetical protein